MLFNNENFGEKVDALVESVFNKTDFEHVPSPPPGDYYLLDDSSTDQPMFLLDDSEDYLIDD